MLSLFEMKWNPKRANTKFPASFLSAYQVNDKCIVTLFSKQPLGDREARGKFLLCVNLSTTLVAR